MPNIANTRNSISLFILTPLSYWFYCISVNCGTTAIVILVGMQNAKDKLNQINEYYFDRCNFFYEFQDLPKKDIAQLCSEILEIKFHPDIVDYVHFHSCGNVRKAMKLIRSVEEIGRYKNLEVISQADLDD